MQADRARQQQLDQFRKQQEQARTADAERAKREAEERKAAIEKAKEEQDKAVRAAIVAAIRVKLKDPDSLKIESVTLTKEMSQGSGLDWKETGTLIATVVFNARNSYGGYGNSAIATVVIRPDGSSGCSIQDQ
jgi:hypothetical protein